MVDHCLQLRENRVLRAIPKRLSTPVPSNMRVDGSGTETSVIVTVITPRNELPVIVDLKIPGARNERKRPLSPC